MPIPVRCVCNRIVNVADRMAGKSINCPSCMMVISVPNQKSPEEAFENNGKTPTPNRRPQSNPTGQAPGNPSFKRPVPSVAQKGRGGWFSFEKRILNGGVIAGLLAMVGAVVWFVLGFLANRIYFYPPFLFAIGLVTFIRGLQSRD